MSTIFGSPLALQRAPQQRFAATKIRRSGAKVSPSGARACIKERIGSTEFWRAEQVKYTMRLGSHVAAEPAIIMGNAGASGVRVKVLNSSFGEMVVNDISALSKLREQFAPGDAVKRAMLSGAEEDATVVRVDSSDAVTIRILPSGPTYSSDVLRLRKVKPTDGEVKSTDGSAATIDVAVLQQKLASKFPQLATSALPNPHAAPGTPLHSRFAAAAAAAPDKVVDVLVHGTIDQNIDSILQSSLRGRAGCGTCWFTDEITTANSYARGAKRMIAFAVLRDKGHSYPIFTTRDPAHHLPIFTAQL